MNFISSLLGRRRDDGASTEPLTTAELLASGTRLCASAGGGWPAVMTTARYARSRDRAAETRSRRPAPPHRIAELLTTTPSPVARCER